MTFTFYFLNDQRLIVPGARSQVAILRDPNPANNHCPWASLSVPSRCLTAARPEIPGGRLAQKSFRKAHKNVDLPTRASHPDTDIQLPPGVAFTCWVRASRSPASPPPQRPHPLGALQPQCTPLSLPPPSLLRLPQIAPSRFPRLPSCFPVATQTRLPSRRGDSCGPGAPWVARACEAQRPGICRPRRGAARALQQRASAGASAARPGGWRGAGVGRARPGM